MRRDKLFFIRLTLKITRMNNASHLNNFPNKPLFSSIIKIQLLFYISISYSIQRKKYLCGININNIMRIKNYFFSAMLCMTFVQEAAARNYPTTYTPVKKEIYHKTWIDLNKNGRMDIYEDRNAPVEKRIDDLLSQMSTEEKTCQMVTLYGYQRILKDSLPTPQWKQSLWKDGIGAIDEQLNGFTGWNRAPMKNDLTWPASHHAWALNETQRFFIEETRLGIPADFTNEGIRGVESYKATNFPTQLGIGHTWNRKLAQQIGYITGREARLLGYTNIYAPIMDVGRDQRWGRYEEVYGESPYLVAEMGIAMAKGLQTNNQVASTAKHFIAYSNNKGAREGLSRVDPQMSWRELEYIHAYPFTRIIREAGILGVMCSYNDYDGFPIASNHYWLTERLRGTMGFHGYVVTDSDALEYLYSKHKTAKDMKEAVKQAVEAGVNVRCTFRTPESFVYPLRELIKEGGISMATIDSRVRDILRVKFLLGLFDHPYQIDLKQADIEVNSEKNRAVALQASRESLVLLKNKGNLLPLNREQIKRIAVCGPNADETSFALTHYGPVAVEVTSVLDGIRNKVAKGTEVVYSKGCELVDSRWPESEIIPEPPTNKEMEQINKAVENIKNSDVAVLVLGGGIRTCGENKSRTSLELPGHQQTLLEAAVATGKPVVLVLINGRPLSINWADKHVPAILEAWYPGSQGGTAVADALFGDYNPGGKLTVTFPKTVGQIPFNFPFKPASQAAVGNTIGTNGNQSCINGALYPFGYGLSYTTFKYSNMKLSQSAITDKQSVTISCNITNTGKRAGDEVVQLYTRDKISSVTTYEKELKGFERIHLQPGETKTVVFQLPAEELRLLNADNHWVVEPGMFKVMIGASSEDIRLTQELKIKNYGDESTKDISHSSGTNYVSSNADNEHAKASVDKNPTTYWSGKKGDYLSFELQENVKTDHLSIQWGDVTPNTRFEIQLSDGGGQFVPIISNVANGRITETINFPSLSGSDLRIVIFSGNAQIKEITVPNRKIK